MPCCGEYGVIPESLLKWAQTTTTTSEYVIIRKPLVATRINEEWTSNATSSSSFLKSEDWWTVTNNDEVSTKVINIDVFHIISIHKVMHFIFSFFFLTKEIFPFIKYNILD